MTLGGSEYLLQHALRDLHMLHGDDLTEFLQGVNVPDLIHELHAAERKNINNMQIIVPNDLGSENSRLSGLTLHYVL